MRSVEMTLEEVFLRLTGSGVGENTDHFMGYSENSENQLGQRSDTE